LSVYTPAGGAIAQSCPLAAGISPGEVHSRAQS